MTLIRLQLFGSGQNVNCFFPDELKNYVQEIGLESNNSSLLHFNARSLVNKMDKVTDFIHDLAHNFAALAVMETWAH